MKLCYETSTAMSGGTSSLLDEHKIGNGCNLTARSKTDARKRRCAPLLAPFNASVRHHKMAQQVADTDFSIRGFLLSEVLRFVKYAATCPGVRRVAVVGSLATDKHDPKDADVLVIVDDDADLTPLAAAGRRLKGRAQSRNKGADIFLADPSGNYIGRTCHWRECRPGIRASCDALNFRRTWSCNLFGQSKRTARRSVRVVPNHTPRALSYIAVPRYSIICRSFA